MVFIANLLAQHRIFDLNVSTLDLGETEGEQKEAAAPLADDINGSNNVTRQDVKDIQLPYNINPLTILFAGQVIGILIFHIIQNNCFKSENSLAAVDSAGLGPSSNKSRSNSGNMLS